VIQARQDTAGLLAHWGVGPAAEITPAVRGSNNHTVLVSEGGRRWVLRISQNLSADQVMAEHRVLARLRLSDLPFDVPERVPTVTGDAMVETAAGPATLCRWIGGVRPDLSSEPALERVGAGLGQLSAALRGLPHGDAPQHWAGGPLATLPAGVAAGELIAELATAGISPEQADLLAASAARADASWHQCAARHLPVQIVHGDVGPSNVLVDEDSGELTGILDFEIAGADFRVQDLVATLLLSGALAGRGWPARATALIRGVAGAVQLEPAEVDAVPELLICRAVGSALWRAGRWRRGLAGLDDVADRLRELAVTMTFAAESGDVLRDLLSRYGRPHTGAGLTNSTVSCPHGVHADAQAPMRRSEPRHRPVRESGEGRPAAGGGMT
jgi:homoserine kinase type II